jgi:predicted RNA binding protein YcfA (HicA-like mRNA interferase family)
MKVREAIKLLRAHGWHLSKTKGSHRHFKHPSKKGKITIPGKTSEDLNNSTLSRILKQAGVKKQKEH